MSPHIVTPRTYVFVYLSLLLLTALTIGASLLDLGQWHARVGLTIAGLKALLVVLFFMHVLYSTKLIWIVILAAVYWLFILIGFTMSDYVSRSWLSA
jgi:cytochrome c oxidase subunit IV